MRDAHGAWNRMAIDGINVGFSNAGRYTCVGRNTIAAKRLLWLFFEFVCEDFEMHPEVVINSS